VFLSLKRRIRGGMRGGPSGGRERGGGEEDSGQPDVFRGTNLGAFRGERAEATLKKRVGGNGSKDYRSYLGKERRLPTKKKTRKDAFLRRGVAAKERAAR